MKLWILLYRLLILYITIIDVGTIIQFFEKNQAMDKHRIGMPNAIYEC